MIQVSIQADHLHLLIEAKDARARSLGIAGLEIAVAKAINRVCGRRGKVFPYRYHAVVLSSPMQVRNVLAYLLGNWRRHREDEGSIASRHATFDPYSSAYAFDGWDRPFDGSGHVGLPVEAPTVWLLTIGWRKHGPLDPHETPGPRARAGQVSGCRRR